MVNANDPVRIDRSVIEQLTIDAMLLADEAESYFGGEDDLASAELSPDLQVEFACEAFRTTTLLKQLVDRLAKPELASRSPTLREPAEPNLIEFSKLPPRARAIVAATRALYERVRDLDEQRALVLSEPPPSPAKQLQERLIATIRA